MIWALSNDIIQRILTLNKWEQKKQLSRHLKTLNLTPGSKVLDFGCGTGLFTRVFEKEKLNYYGYDIDKRLISYARLLYQNCKFTTEYEVLAKGAPFHLIISNCCFHHIHDSLLAIELTKIREWLSDNGTFIMIDLLKVENDPSFLRRLFRKLERGAYIRCVEDYRKILKQYFKIINKVNIQRSSLFSLKHIPVYNNLVIFECNK